MVVYNTLLGWSWVKITWEFSVLLLQLLVSLKDLSIVYIKKVYLVRSFSDGNNSVNLPFYFGFQEA